MAEQHPKPDEPIPSDLVREDASVADFVQAFVDGLGKRVADMATALGDGDFQMLRHLAHQLNGSGGGYGYPALSELAADLEEQALSEALPDCQRVLDELKGMVSRVVVKLD